jgi:release factor glutamine methyltransferase
VGAEHRLREAGVDAPESAARYMVEEASGYEGAELVVAALEPATSVAIAHLDDMVARRVRGEPLQYVLGRWQFRGHDLFLDPRVLIPRPETEVVAQVALEEAERLGARRGRGDRWAAASTSFAVADLGTGSGALAIALAAELPEAEVWATDVSADALAVARANFGGAGSLAARIRVAAGSWFDALPEHLRGSLRLVVTNPPYVAEHEMASLSQEVRDWEPRRALVGGTRGTEAIDEIVDRARVWLDPQRGVLVCELAPHQAADRAARARAAGFVDVSVRPDLTGRDRVLVARLGDEAEPRSQ